MSMENQLRTFKRRLDRLGVSASELDILNGIELLELHAQLANSGRGNSDRGVSAAQVRDAHMHLDGVAAAIEHELRAAEALQHERPFVDPPFLYQDGASRATGGVPLADTWNGIPLLD